MKKLTILGSFLIAAAVLTSCGGNDPAADAKAYQDCLCSALKLGTDGKADEATKKTEECVKLTAGHVTAYADDADGAKAYTEALGKLSPGDCPE